jgi:hypothetical protein
VHAIDSQSFEGRLNEHGEALAKTVLEQLEKHGRHLGSGRQVW